MFYKTFWGLQQYFQRPFSFHPPAKWADFLQRADAVLAAFAAHNLEDRAREQDKLRAKQGTAADRRTRRDRDRKPTTTAAGTATVANGTGHGDAMEVETGEHAASATTPIRAAESKPHFTKFLTSAKLMNLQVRSLTRWCPDEFTSRAPLHAHTHALPGKGG